MNGLNGKATTVVWQFVDGLAGHENQSSGLIQSLARVRTLDTHRLTVANHCRVSQALNWLFARCPQASELPDPDLIIGAGHATHFPMMSARRARGGRTIVLMKPSLPLGLFDLCVVPEHDQPIRRDNLLVTRGVLNRLRPGEHKDSSRGLILLGGPSKHHAWSDVQLLEQLEAITADEKFESWLIATSRRTPAETITRLRRLESASLSVVSVDSVDAEWLPGELSRCATAWVSEDSVSMLYEALSAGAATGLIEVPSKAPSRVQRGIEGLIAEGWITTFAQWRKDGVLKSAPQQFNESERVARAIVEKWL